MYTQEQDYGSCLGILQSKPSPPFSATFSLHEWENHFSYGGHSDLFKKSWHTYEDTKSRSCAPKALRACHSPKLPSAIWHASRIRLSFMGKGWGGKRHDGQAKPLMRYIHSMTAANNEEPHLKGASIVTQCLWKSGSEEDQAAMTGIFCNLSTLPKDPWYSFHLNYDATEESQELKPFSLMPPPWVKWFLNKELVADQSVVSGLTRLPAPLS